MSLNELEMKKYRGSTLSSNGRSGCLASVVCLAEQVIEHMLIVI